MRLQMINSGSVVEKNGLFLPDLIVMLLSATRK